MSKDTFNHEQVLCAIHEKIDQLLLDPLQNDEQKLRILKELTRITREENDKERSKL